MLTPTLINQSKSVNFKFCISCGRLLPVTPLYFNVKAREQGSKDGFRPDCKKCRNAKRRNNKAKNPDHANEYNRKWFEQNKGKQRQYYLNSIGETEESLSIKKQQKEKEQAYKKIQTKLHSFKQNGRKTGKWTPPIQDIFGNKKCTICGKYYPNNKEHYSTRPDSIDGFKRFCKQCEGKKNRKSSMKYIFYESDIFQRLSEYEDVRVDPKDSKLGQVKCTYCGKWINIKYTNAKARIYSCENINVGESRIYCEGDQCREACPTYKQQFYPKGFKPNSSREVDPLIRQMCMDRDNYQCQKCDATGEGVTLHAHHIQPYAQNKILGNDVDNVITLCKQCHNEIHLQDGCKYHELRCDVA
ncbi:MAG: HNH endonuclease [Desulfamplus sp.]|nr:HNH endonuclease [Desulfamplus sp.]